MYAGIPTNTHELRFRTRITSCAKSLLRVSLFHYVSQWPVCRKFDLSRVTVRTLSRDVVRGGETRSRHPSGKTPRDCGRRAVDVWTSSYVQIWRDFLGGLSSEPHDSSACLSLRLATYSYV
jgi:hypothetical protein